MLGLPALVWAILSITGTKQLIPHISNFFLFCSFSSSCAGGSHGSCHAWCPPGHEAQHRFGLWLLAVCSEGGGAALEGFGAKHCMLNCL